MQSGAVIEGFDVIEDGGASCGVGGKALVIDQLVFESAPEGFDKGVVVAVSWTAHGSSEPVLGQDLAVGSTRELAAAISMDDKFLSWPTLQKRHAQSGNDQWGVEAWTHGPTDHAPSKDIQDGDQIQPALSGKDAGGIARPDLVRPLDC